MKNTMGRSSSPPALMRSAKVSAPLLVLVLGLSGCAQLPSLEKLAIFKPVSDYQSSVSLQAPASAWPEEQWWKAYGDPQLNALIEEALRSSPDMTAASARLRHAEAFAQTADSATLPQVNANASISSQKLSYNYLTPQAMTPQGWNDYGRATVDLQWELDFWGKNRAGLAAATSQIDASRAELAHARLSLAAAVAGNYAELVRLYASHDTVRQSVDIRRQTVSMFEKRFANGMENQGSLSEVQSRLASAEGELLMLEEQISLQRNRIAALLGAGPDLGTSIQRPAMTVKRSYGLPDELATNLLGRRPDVVAARLQVQARLRRIDQSKAAFYPNINLSAFIGVQALRLDMLDKNGSDIGGVGPAISLPIFSGGRLKGELRGSVAAYDEAVANYNRTVTQALQDVANAGLSQKALTTQLQKAEAAVQAATESHRVARNRFEGGLATYLEVLYAEDGLLTSQRNLTALQTRSIALDVSLQRALGGGYHTSNTL